MEARLACVIAAATLHCGSDRRAMSAGHALSADSGRSRDDSHGDTRPLAGFQLEPEDVWLLARVAAGDTTEKVARQLGVSERTIRRRLRAIADDLGVDSTIEAVVRAVRLGLI